MKVITIVSLLLSLLVSTASPASAEDGESCLGDWQAGGEFKKCTGVYRNGEYVCVGIWVNYPGNNPCTGEEIRMGPTLP